MSILDPCPKGDNNLTRFLVRRAVEWTLQTLSKQFIPRAKSLLLICKKELPGLQAEDVLHASSSALGLFILLLDYRHLLLGGMLTYQRQGSNLRSFAPEANALIH
jgi:hypothetical protein